MTRDLQTKSKIQLPDGSEQIVDEPLKERPKWPYHKLEQKKGSCPFSLIYKKWVVHPDDKSKHPAYINPQTIKADGLTIMELKEKQQNAKSNNEALSQTEGVGVYYLSKFRGIHNHPLDLNMMDTKNTIDIFKKRVVGRPI